MADPRSIIEFMTFAEGLKNVLRHSYTTGGRLESVAEHSWSLCLLAMAVFDTLELEVDQLHVLKLLIAHDIPEIITGDIPVFEKLQIAEQAAADEEKAVQQLAQMTPIGAELAALCHEFEMGDTNEAQLARALDKLEAHMQHNTADIGTWDQNDFDYQTDLRSPIRKRFDIDPLLQALKAQLDRDTLRKIADAGMLHRANDDAVRTFMGTIQSVTD